MKFVQIIAWRDGLIALDDFGGLWFGSLPDNIPPMRWNRLNIPDSREMGHP